MGITVYPPASTTTSSGSSATSSTRTDQYGRVKPWCSPTVTRVNCTIFKACVEPSSCLGGCMSYCNASQVTYGTQKVVPIGNSCFWVMAASNAQRAHVIAAAFCLDEDGVPCQKTDFCCIFDLYNLSGGCCSTSYDMAAIDDCSGRAYLFWTGRPECWCGYKINFSSFCWDTSSNNVCVKCQAALVSCDTGQGANNLRHLTPMSYGDGCNVVLGHRCNQKHVAVTTHFMCSCKRSTLCMHCWPASDCQNTGFLPVGRKGSTLGFITTLCQSCCWKFIEVSPNSSNTASCRQSIFLNCCTNDISGMMYGWDYIDDGGFGIAGGSFACFNCQQCFQCSKTGFILDTCMGCRSGSSIVNPGCDSAIPKALHEGRCPCYNLYGPNCNYGSVNFGEIITGTKYGIEATGYMGNPWFTLDSFCDPVKFPWRTYYDTTGAWGTTCILRRYGWDASSVFDCVPQMKNMAAFVDEYHLIGVHCVCSTTDCMCFALQVACFE